MTTRPTKAATSGHAPRGPRSWVRALVVAALAATAARAGAGPDTQARLQQLHQRGRLHLSTGNYEGALDAAARMLRLAPGHADALRLEQDTHRARL